MTKQEMRDRFYRRIYQSEGKSKFTPTEADAYMADKQKEVTRLFRLYIKPRVVPVAAATNQFALSAVKPVATAGESYRLLPSGIQYQEGKSGIITAFALGTGGAGYTKATSTAHGLADGDIVEIHDSTNYSSTRYTVSDSATNYFDINETYTAETPSASTAFVQETTNEMFNLNPGTFEEVQELYSNYINPTSSEVPRGTLFIPWLVSSENLPALATDLSELIVPEDLQAIIPDWAALDALLAINDNRAPSLEATVAMEKAQCAAYSEDQYPENPVIIGRFRMTSGMYAYRQTTLRAFIFWPRTW